MFSFIWWVSGFYWVTAGGQNLTQESPKLYWFVWAMFPFVFVGLLCFMWVMQLVFLFCRLCITFLAFDVVFVIICVAVACLIGIAICCCLPCIIGILYAMTDRVIIYFKFVLMPHYRGCVVTTCMAHTLYIWCTDI